MTDMNKLKLAMMVGVAAQMGLSAATARAKSARGDCAVAEGVRRGPARHRACAERSFAQDAL